MISAAVCFFLGLFHPFYVSVTEISHNQKSKSVEVSSRIFLNDLESALQKRYKQKVDLVKASDKENLNLILSDYFRKHLRISVNAKQVSLKYLGYEIEEDGAWCYLEVLGVSRVKTLDVQNLVLLDDHPEQVNILHVIVKKERKV